MIIDAQGLINSIEYLPSPNCDDRPADAIVSLIVIHGISLPPGEFGGPWINHLFTNQLNPNQDPFFADIASLKVSSHILIRRDGTIIQYVPFSKRAWHAGESCFEGRHCCNDYSVGIELEGTDELAYESVQYEQLAKLVACLIEHYPAISEKRVTGHADIAPGRKTDPGDAFSWSQFRKLLASLQQVDKT